jgi:hypothetical protein
MPDGEMVALMRREGGNCSACLGRSKPPYTRWEWREIGHRLGGPNLIRLPNGDIWAGGRQYAADDTASADAARTRVVTAVGRITLDGTYDPRVILPSSGDTGYPGLVWHDGALWVSYYSSHEEKASIYLARVSTG